MDISSGTFHAISSDLKRALLAKAKSLKAWQSISPLARNEWICWVESVKRAETRAHHIKRVVSELAEGKRRPCCWVGCVHRSDKKMSATQKWVLGRSRKK